MCAYNYGVCTYMLTYIYIYTYKCTYTYTYMNLYVLANKQIYIYTYKHTAYNNNNKCRIFTRAFYLSLWLVKALRLPATPALLCSDRGCADSRPPHDVTNFEIDLCSFFYWWRKREYPEEATAT